MNDNVYICWEFFCLKSVSDIPEGIRSAWNFWNLFVETVFCCLLTSLKKCYLALQEDGKVTFQRILNTSHSVIPWHLVLHHVTFAQSWKYQACALRTDSTVHLIICVWIKLSLNAALRGFIKGSLALSSRTTQSRVYTSHKVCPGPLLRAN